MNIKQIGLVGLLSVGLSGSICSGETETRSLLNTIIIEQTGYQITKRVEHNGNSDERTYSYSSHPRGTLASACITTTNNQQEKIAHYLSFSEGDNDGGVDGKVDSFCLGFKTVVNGKTVEFGERAHKIDVNIQNLYDQLRKDLDVDSVHKQWVEKYGKQK